MMNELELLSLTQAFFKQCCGSGMILSDPDPTFQLVSGPDPDPDLVSDHT